MFQIRNSCYHISNATVISIIDKTRVLVRIIFYIIATVVIHFLIIIIIIIIIISIIIMSSTIIIIIIVLILSRQISDLRHISNISSLNGIQNTESSREDGGKYIPSLTKEYFEVEIS